MKRLLITIAALALLASACSSSSDVVATVNGVDIPRSTIEGLAPNGETPSASDFNQYLAVSIQWEALSQAALTDYGIDPSAEEISSRLEELVAGQGTGATLDDYLALTQASEVGIREFTKQLIIQEAVQDAIRTALGPVDESEVTRELVDFPLDWTVVCTSHILLGTEEDAFAALERINAGESFAEVAISMSLDAQSGSEGGTLGCGSPTEFLDVIADATIVAEVDVPTEPIQSDFGYHILLVTQREEATPEIVRQAIEREAVAETTEAWFTSVVANAIVTVLEEIGTWTTDPTPSIVGR